MKVIIWANYPSHHQSAFFEALRKKNVDLLVRYYNVNLFEERKKQGWIGEELAEGEEIIEPTVEAVRLIPEYRSYLHVVPGYGAPFLRKIARLFSQESIEWVHWSECSTLGIRWYLRYPVKRWFGELVNRFALGAFAQGILAKNDFQKWGISVEKIAYLYYAPKLYGNNKIDKKCFDFLSGRNAIVFLGAQCRRKAIDVLIRAFYAIESKARPNWAILIVGKDYSNGKYVKLVNDLNLNDEVFFRDAVPSNDISMVLKCAKVLVLPSRFDGWGVALNEGMANGLALIGSDKTGATHHLIQPGINGFHVRSGSVESLKHALQAYMSNPVLAEKHGKASLKVLEEFTPEKNAERFLLAIESWRSIVCCKLETAGNAKGNPQECKGEIPGIAAGH